MADNEDLMAEFQEFLTAKRAQEQEESSKEDYEVEVWNEKGQGARLKRSHAKPFLQSLGIDLDPPEKKDDDGGEEKAKPKPKGKTTTNTGTVRKYFAPKAAGK